MKMIARTTRGQRVRLLALTLLFVLGFGGMIVSVALHDSDSFGFDKTSYGTQEVRIFVPGEPVIPPEVNMRLEDVAVNGKVVEEGGVADTYNASNEISFTVEGIGLIEIKDKDGNVVYSYNKTNPEPENIVAKIKLENGVGEYPFIIIFSNDEGHTIVRRLTINYLPLLPEVPSTGGFTQIIGFAVPNFMVYPPMMVMAIIGMFVLAYRRRKAEANETEKLKAFRNLPVKKAIRQTRIRR